MPDFDTVQCEGCGRDLSVPKGNPDSVHYHRACAWYEVACEICGKLLRIHRDWQNPPRACKECKEAARAAWYQAPCEICGGPITIYRDSDNPPRVHEHCKEAAKPEPVPKWYELPCEVCGDPIRIHREWMNPPRTHKACKKTGNSDFTLKSCEFCGGPIRVNIKAVKVPKYHDKCEAKALAAAVRSPQCDLRRLTVFLCHSSGDKPKIRELYKRLRNDGFAPWLDEEELVPGQDWNHEITKAVRSSHVVVVCLSTSSAAKTGYVQKEIKYALDIADEQPEGTIFLIPLKLEEREVPSRLQRWQWVKLFEESGYERLLRALKLRQEYERSAAAIIPAAENLHKNA